MHLSLQTFRLPEDLKANIFNHFSYVHCATFENCREKEENSCDCIQFDIRTAHSVAYIVHPSISVCRCGENFNIKKSSYALWSADWP